MVRLLQEKQANLEDIMSIVRSQEEIKIDELIAKGFCGKPTTLTTEQQLDALGDINGIEKLSDYNLGEICLRNHQRSIYYVLLIFITHNRKVFTLEQANQIVEILNKRKHGDFKDFSNPVGLFKLLVLGDAEVPSPGYNAEQLKLFDSSYEMIIHLGIALNGYLSFESISIYAVASFALYLEATKSDIKFLDELKSWNHENKQLTDLLGKIDNFMWGRNNSKTKSTQEQARYSMFLWGFFRDLESVRKSFRNFLSVEQNRSTKTYFLESNMSSLWRLTAYPFQAISSTVNNSINLQLFILNDLIKLTLQGEERKELEKKIVDISFSSISSNDPFLILVAAHDNLQTLIDLLQVICSLSVYSIELREKEELENPSNKKKKLSFKLGRGPEYFMEKVLKIPRHTSSTETPVTNSPVEIEEKQPKESVYKQLDFNYRCMEARRDILELFESKNQERRLPKVAKGVKDTDPSQMKIKNKVFDLITGVFKQHGAVQIDTPVFELKETLVGKYGEEGGKLIYDLEDQGGELLSLRYDLTVPFARYIATNNLKKIKRFHIGKVYRRDQPDFNRGRYREFYQCDLDIAGQYEPMICDAEILSIIDQIMTKLDLGKFEIKLCHRVLLEGIIVIAGAPLSKFKTICSSIDKLDKEPWEKVAKELINEKGVELEVTERIKVFVENKGKIDEMIEKFEKEGLFSKHPDSLKALEDMKLLSKYLKLLRAYDNITFDLSLARGLDYYTGIIYEIVVDGSRVGSVGAGGRYDNLVGMFGSSEIPCIGLSIGIERIFVLLEDKLKKENVPIRENDTQFLIATIGKGLLDNKLEVLSRIWSAGCNAEIIYEQAPKPAKQLTYALESQVPFIIWIGEDEIKSGVVKVKVESCYSVHLYEGRDRCETG